MKDSLVSAKLARRVLRSLRFARRCFVCRLLGQAHWGGKADAIAEDDRQRALQGLHRERSWLGDGGRRPVARHELYVWSDANLKLKLWLRSYGPLGCIRLSRQIFRLKRHIEQ